MIGDVRDLMRVSDIAAQFDVSRQRADQLTRRDTFPAVAVVLGKVRFWWRADVAEFEKRWDRTPGRRPERKL